MLSLYVFFFFVKQKTAYEMRISDWSSDVCSSDLTRRAGSGEGLGEGIHEVLQLALGVVGERLLGADRLEDARRLRLDLRQQLLLEPADLGDCDPVQVAAHAGEDRDHLLLDRHRAELRLVQQFGQRSEESRVGDEGVRKCR